MKNEFKHLKRWSLPSSYFGAQWPDYYVFLSRNRDSDCLTRANFDAGLKRLGGESNGLVEVVRENHWACGWIEWIGVHQEAEEKLSLADDMLDAIEDYPALDENLWSEYETKEANQVWRNCYTVDERVKYIRAHRDQFEFRDLGDILGCVRGNYFAGYAEELIR